MQLDELIEVVEKKRKCHIEECRCGCSKCDYYVTYEQTSEMYDDILVRLTYEKWASDKRKEMRVEEVD